MARNRTLAGSAIRFTRNMLIALFVLAAFVGGMVAVLTILIADIAN